MRSVAIILHFAASAAAAAVGTDLPLPLGEIGWEGVAAPGEPAIEVWGSSFEQIEAKIQQDHPEFQIYVDEEQVDPDSSEDPAVVARDVLEARMKGRRCDKRFGEVIPDHAEKAINNLKKIAGNKCRARARTCIRTQCVGNAAVGLCNDNTHNIEVACTHVARMAQDIFNNCNSMDTECGPKGCSGQNWTTFGQVFSDGGTWNVILGRCSYFGNGERPVKA